MSGKSYFVYILASRSRNLYTGITNDLERRVYEHKTGRVPGFTTRYRIHRLACFEAFGNVNAAIAREKQIKAWRREKRVALIEQHNPAWDDLSDGWYSPKVEYASFDGMPNQKQIPRPLQRARDDKNRSGRQKTTVIESGVQQN